MRNLLWAAFLILAACGGDNSARDFPLAKRTYLSFSEAHGVQISYYDFDTVWLWYPGNSTALKGTWRIAGGNPFAICFTYPTNSFNPATRRSGGQEECGALGDVARSVRQSLPGDVFALQTGRVPNRRERCDVPPPFDPVRC